MIIASMSKPQRAARHPINPRHIATNAITAEIVGGPSSVMVDADDEIGSPLDVAAGGEAGMSVSIVVVVGGEVGSSVG